jgi:hypothetical protein
VTDDAEPEPENEVPPSEDPRWAEWVVPLHGYLRALPRSWEDLRRWRAASGTSASMLHNMLSWMSNNRMVDWDGRLWRAIGEPERRVLVEADEALRRLEREELPTSRPGPGQFFFVGSRSSGSDRSDRSG